MLTFPFWQTRKRKRNNNIGFGHKRARLECTRKSIHFDAVYQNQRAVKKHIIVRRPTDFSQPGKFYIIRCDQHDISFDRNPLQDASTHLRVQHRILNTDHDTVIEHLGIEVIECDDEKLKQNNAVARKALEDGTNNLGRDCIRVREDSDSPESSKSRRYRAAQRIRNQKASRSNRRGSQYDNDEIPLNLVPGNVYIIYWIETQEWFASVLLPLQDLESVGIDESFEEMELFKTLPSCYQYDSSSRSLSWAQGYEDGGPKCSERHYPFIFFEGFQFPNHCHKAWIELDDIRPWDENKAERIEHSYQAVEYLRERNARNERETQTLGNKLEIPDSMDGGKLFQNGSCRGSDRECDEDSDLDDFGHSSPLAESSTDQQVPQEQNVATPDTVDELEILTQPNEIFKKADVNVQCVAQSEEQSEESNEDMMDVCSDTDGDFTQQDNSPRLKNEASQPATPSLQELTLQQEEVLKNPDIEPESIAGPPHFKVGENDKMDLVPMGETNLPDQCEETRRYEDTDKEKNVVPPSTELRPESVVIGSDVLMTTPDEDEATQEGSHLGKQQEVNAQQTIAHEFDDTSEQLEATRPTEMHLRTEFQFPHSSEKSNLPRYNSEEISHSTCQTVNNRGANEGILTIIRSSPPVGDTTEEKYPEKHHVPGPTSQEPGSPRESTSSQVLDTGQKLILAGTPGQNSPSTIDLETLLQEGEKLELQLSQSEPATKQSIPNNELSPTSSDHSRLAEGIFKSLLAEGRQFDTPPRSASRTNSPPNNSYRDQWAKSRETRSQTYSYDEMGEPASVGSRPVSKGSDIRQTSYDEIGSPASKLRGQPSTSNTARCPSYRDESENASAASRPSTRDGKLPKQQTPYALTGHPASTSPVAATIEPRNYHSPYAVMGQRASTPSRPSTRNGDASQKPSPYSERDRHASAVNKPATASNKSLPENTRFAGIGQRTHSTHSRSSSRGIDIRPQVTEPASRETPAKSHHETPPTSLSPSVQIPFRGTPTLEKPLVKPSTGSWLQHVTIPSTQAAQEATRPSIVRSASEAMAPAQQPLNISAPRSGVLRHPHAHPAASLPAVEMTPSLSLSTSSQRPESVISVLRQPATDNARAYRTTETPPASQGPSSAQHVLPFPRRQTEPYIRPPGSGPVPSPDFSPIQLNQLAMSPTFKTPPATNGNAGWGVMPSPRQPSMQSPRLPSIPQSTPLPQVMPSPRQSHSSISRSSSLSQGYTVPPPDPLPSPQQMVGEVEKSFPTSQNFRVSASPRRPAREFTRSHTATYRPARAHVVDSPQQTAVSLPPSSTVGQGTPSSQVNASPRLQAMEISRPNSALHRSRPPTSPRHHAMNLDRPSPVVHGATLSHVVASPQTAARDIPRPGFTVQGQSTHVATHSPRQNSASMLQPIATIQGNICQPPITSSPRLRDTELARPNTAGYRQSRPQTFPSPPQSTLGIVQPSSVSSQSVTVSPRLVEASLRRPQSSHGMRGTPLSTMSPRPAPVTTTHTEPVSQARHYNPLDQHSPSLHRQGSNYIPAAPTSQNYTQPAQTQTSMGHSRRHSHSAGQPYSNNNNPKSLDSTPRSHAPPYQVPVQCANPTLSPGPLVAYLPPHVAEALIERTGRRGDDLQPTDFLNYGNKYQCPFCKVGMPGAAVFVQHLQRLCPYTQLPHIQRKTTQVGR